MMGRRTFAAIVMGGVTALLSGCNPFGPSSFRYRMTVEVDTPQGMVTGFAVRQVEFMTRANGGPYGYVRGEAVAVDIAPGRMLFALLTSAKGSVDYAGHGIWTVLNAMDRGTGLKGGPHALWPKVPVIGQERFNDPLPMLVTFRDITDPKSVTQVDPTGLAAAFGPGVKLRRITVAVTDEPVTGGIAGRLGWLSSQRGSLIPATLQSSVEIKQLSSVTEAAFIQGNSQ